VGLEPTISVFERAKTFYDSDSAATVIGSFRDRREHSRMLCPSIQFCYSVTTSKSYGPFLLHNDPTIHSHHKTKSSVCKNLEGSMLLHFSKNAQVQCAIFSADLNRMGKSVCKLLVYAFCIVLHSRIQMWDGRRNDGVFPCRIWDSLE
jgi:hypothetical protein